MTEFPLVSNSEEQNRISVIYSLSIFGDGIKQHVIDQFDLMHQKLVCQLSYLNTQCAQSCSRNKPYVQNWCPTCSAWRTAILSFHRHGSVIVKRKIHDWSLIDSSKWPTDPSEVKKCFEPEWCKTPGINKNVSDVSIIISIMTNCRLFTQDVKPLRQIRNSAVHENKLTDATKAASCETLRNFLRNDPNIWCYHEAKVAHHTISILKADSLKDVFDRHLLEELQLRQIKSMLVENSSCFSKMHTCFPLAAGFVLLLAIVFAYCLLDYKTKECEMGFKLDFNTYQEDIDFVGRKWLLDSLDKKLSNSIGVLLIAEPGYGKTALITQIIKAKHKITKFRIVHHLCKYDIKTFLQADRFVLNVFQSFFCTYTEFADVISKNKLLSLTDPINIENMCRYDPDYCMSIAVIGPLQEMKPTKNETVLIIVDSLDECDTEFNSVVLLLHKWYDKFPYWIKFLFTTRSHSKIINYFNQLEHWHLSTTDEHNKFDTVEYVKKHLENSLISEAVAKRSKYNFLYLKIVLKTKLNVNNLPETINDVFYKELHRLFNNCEKETFKKPRGMFEIILASSKPLRKLEIFDVLKFTNTQFDDEYDIDRLVDKMTPQLIYVSANQEISLIHSNVKDVLSIHGHPCYVNHKHGHKNIAIKKLHDFKNYGCKDVSFSDVQDFIKHVHLADDNELHAKLKFISQACVNMSYCFQNLNRTNCESILDVTSKSFNTYRLTKTLLSTWKDQNATMAAKYAAISSHTETFKALVEYGRVDYSALSEMFDLKSLAYDHKSDRFVEKDAFSVVHFAVSHRNLEAVKHIIKYNVSALKYKTRSGFSVLDIAVMNDDIDIFKLCFTILPIDLNILRLSAFFQAYDIFRILLGQGIRDRCYKCTSDIILQANRTIYFSSKAKTIDIEKKKISSIKYVDANFNELLWKITCESILHYAVRIHDNEMVKQILMYSNSTLECTDFNGLTPLAGSIIFQNRVAMKYLLRNGANINFTCKPIDARDRKKMLRELNVYDLYYTSLPFDKYCPDGAAFVHLLAFRPTCDMMQNILQVHEEILKHRLDDRDSQNHSLLFYILCTNFAGHYDIFAQERRLRMLLFVISLFNTNIEYANLLEYSGLCGTGNLRTNSLTESSLSLINLCKLPHYHFPRLGDILIGVDGKIYKRKNIRTLFPIKKKSKLDILYRAPDQITKHIISLYAKPMT